MSKAKSAKVIPLDVEEEKGERKKYYGQTKAEIEAAASAIYTQQQKSAEVSGSLSGKLDVFEKAGGRKGPMKTAAKIAKMEPDEMADYWRALYAYCDALGVFDQLDMFDQQREKELNEASIAKASSPEFAEEHVH